MSRFITTDEQGNIHPRPWHDGNERGFEAYLREGVYTIYECDGFDAERCHIGPAFTAPRAELQQALRNYCQQEN